MKTNMLPSATYVAHAFKLYASIAICSGIVMILGAFIFKMPLVLVAVAIGFYAGHHKKEVISAVVTYWHRLFDHAGFET